MPLAARLPDVFAATLELAAPLSAFDHQHGLWLCDAHCLRRLDLRTGRVVRHPLPLDLDTPRALAVAPDASQVVIADVERSLHIRHPLEPARLRRADLYVTGVADAAYDPSGRWLALAHGEEGVLLVDTESMEPLWAAEFIASQQPILRFSADGARLAVNTCEAVVVFDCTDGRQLQRIEPHDEALFTWSADAELVTCDLAVDCGARLLRALPGTPSDELPDPPPRFERLRSTTTRAVALTREPSGTVLAATTDGTIARLGDSVPRILARLEPPAPGAPARTPLRLELSPDGAHLASRWSDGRVRLYRLP